MYSNFIINFKREFLFQRYEGRIGARKGIFPATYVDVTVEPGETRSTGGNLLIIYQLSIIGVIHILSYSIYYVNWIICSNLFDLCT